MLADAFVHDLNPVIVPISGSLAIRWYGLSYLVGFLIAWVLLRWLAKTNRARFTPAGAMDLIVYCVVGVVAGGRLGYCLFYDLTRSLEEGVTPLLWGFGADFPFWGVLRVTDGGMASHGGMLGVMVAVWLFARKYRAGWPHVMDTVSWACLPGLGLGRIANFINGELWGKRLGDDLQGGNSPWWSVKYPDEIVQLASDPDTSGTLASATGVAEAAGIDPGSWQLHITRFATSDESRSLVHGWVDRIVQQLREGNEELASQLQQVLVAYYPSQLIQAVVEGVIMFSILCLIWLKPRKTGVNGASFLIAYGVLRILTEVFRQPDTNVNLILGLQRGQFLSALMIVGGIVALIWVLRREGDPIGGFLRKAPVQSQGAASGTVAPEEEAV